MLLKDVKKLFFSDKKYTWFIFIEKKCGFFMIFLI